MDPLTQAVQEQQALLKGVRDYALAHYEKGWDIIVECYDDAELAEEIGNATTVTGAINKLRPMIKIHKEQYDTIQSEVL